MVYIGIDPGKQGAISILYENKIKVYDMPVLANGEINAGEICMLLREPARTRNSICSIEKAQAMPKQGSVSMFKYGMGYGTIKGVLACLNISYQEVPSRTWKKNFSLTSDKKESIVLAIKLFPDSGIDFYTPRGRMLDGRAEAILLAEYARRNFK